MPLPDVVAAMRRWALDDPDVSAIFGTAVATTLPDPDRRPLPFLRLFDASTNPTLDESPRELVLVQWDVYAGKVHDDRTAPDWATASNAARTLADRLRGFDGISPEFPGFSRRVTIAPGEDVVVGGAQVVFGPVRQPDPEGLARYRVDSLVTAKNG